MHMTPYFGGRTQTISSGQQRGQEARTPDCPRVPPQRDPSTASVNSEGQDRCGVDTKGWNTVPRSSAAGVQGVQCTSRVPSGCRVPCWTTLASIWCPSRKRQGTAPSGGQRRRAGTVEPQCFSKLLLGQLGALFSQYI